MKKTTSVSDDYDSPWKEVIERYFPEFVGFFFPKAYEEIDWEMFWKELTELEKENSLERIGFKRGIQQGNWEGKFFYHRKAGLPRSSKLMPRQNCQLSEI